VPHGVGDIVPPGLIAPVLGDIAPALGEATRGKRIFGGGRAPLGGTRIELLGVVVMLLGTAMLKEALEAVGDAPKSDLKDRSSGEARVEAVSAPGPLFRRSVREE